METNRKTIATIILLFSLFVSGCLGALSAMAASLKAGSYELNLYGDAIGFYYTIQTFQNVKMKNFQLSTDLDSYVPTIMSVDVKNLGMEASSERTFHLSVNGLKDFSYSVAGLNVLSIRCGNGDFDFIFSYDLHILDIYGVLKGDVLFEISMPGFEEYTYEGPSLLLHVHMGMFYIRGDVISDGKIDVRDCAVAAKSFGLGIEDLGYRLCVDLNLDGKIDVIDISTVARNFGKTA